ncbi:DUF1270 family protein, partial [Staphylococcus aureus]
IVLMTLLYFTTAWSIAGVASNTTVMYYKEYYFKEKKNCYLLEQVTVSNT